MGEYLILGLVNLAILAVAAVYFLKRPVQTYLFSRSKNLKERKSKAMSSLTWARDEYRNYYTRLQNIDQDMKGLMSAAESEGERDGEGMIIQAEQIVDRVIEQSVTRADNIVSRKNREFYVDIVERSVSQAEKLMRGKLSLEAQVALGRSFLKRLDERGSEGG